MPLESIEPIHRIYATGQRPVIVLCADFNDYICKYPSLTPAQSLMTEWICAHVAALIGLSIPPFDIIFVKDDHAPVNKYGQLLPGARLNQPLFGSRHIKSLDMDKRFLNTLNSHQNKAKLEDKDQLLRIALFDIWVSNEDRHGNNYNLLVAVAAKKYRWFVIDHGACFNSLAAFSQELAPLTYQESLISSDLFAVIFQKPANFVARVQAICEELEIWRNNAQQQIEQWVVDAPDQWGIDRQAWITFLRERWLSADWTTQTQQTFLEHTQFLHNT